MRRPLWPLGDKKKGNTPENPEVLPLKHFYLIG